MIVQRCFAKKLHHIQVWQPITVLQLHTCSHIILKTHPRSDRSCQPKWKAARPNCNNYLFSSSHPSSRQWWVKQMSWSKLLK